ncbi:MAG: PHP domain-containing protein [Eubacteriales bacterium]|nr:PHP domain-containing protein [Eubacteriales bacterium]
MTWNQNAVAHDANHPYRMHHNKPHTKSKLPLSFFGFCGKMIQSAPIVVFPLFAGDKRMTCDLHIHSVYSDGTRTPAEIIAEAKRLGLAVALTDHNTTAGLPDFLSEAEKQGVQAIPGIELSTDYEGREFTFWVFLLLRSITGHWNSCAETFTYRKKSATEN